MKKIPCLLVAAMFIVVSNTNVLGEKPPPKLQAQPNAAGASESIEGVDSFNFSDSLGFTFETSMELSVLNSEVR